MFFLYPRRDILVWRTPCEEILPSHCFSFALRSPIRIFFQTGNLNKEYDETTLGPRIVLTFLGMKYAVVNEELSEALLSIYTGKHADVLVSYESLPPEQYYRLLQRRIRTDSLDDVFMVWSGDVRAYQQKGILLNLENLPALSSYRQEVLEQMRIDGRISFIPISLSAYAMYCNKNLLKEYGVEEPQNGAELLAACETFRKQGIQPIIADMESLKALVLSGVFSGTSRTRMCYSIRQIKIRSCFRHCFRKDLPFWPCSEIGNILTP